jgi:hypothetical protein
MRKRQGIGLTNRNQQFDCKYGLGLTLGKKIPGDIDLTEKTNPKLRDSITIIL